MLILDGSVRQSGELNLTSSCMKSFVQVTCLSINRESVEKNKEHSFKYISLLHLYLNTASALIAGICFAKAIS